MKRHLNWQKMKQMQHSEAELSLFKDHSLSSSTLSTKNNRRHSKKYTKSKCVCLPFNAWW